MKEIRARRVRNANNKQKKLHKTHTKHAERFVKIEQRQTKNTIISQMYTYCVYTAIHSYYMNPQNINLFILNVEIEHI